MNRRVSRRTFLGATGGAAVLAAGGSAWALLGTRESEGTPAAPEPTPTLPPTSTPSPTPTLPPPPPGGRQVITAPGSFDIDTFDAQLTGKSATVEILGRTHSRLVQWVDVGTDPKLEGDLAASWETPDPATCIFTLDPAARWHDKAPVNGRPVTAEDVVRHFQRALELRHGEAPLAQRYHWYTRIASITSPGEGIVQFRLDPHDEFLLDTLASEFALIQAPEAVEAFGTAWSRRDSDHVIGSGPWTFDWADGGLAFTAFRGGHRQAQLDEILVGEAGGAARRFVDGALDETIAFDRREATSIREAFSVVEANAAEAATGEAVSEHHRPAREIVLSSFNLDSPPWNHPLLIEALSGALNRYELTARLFGGRATPAQPVPVGGTAGRISPERLQAVPGYNRVEGVYSPDPAARQKWEAAGGPGLGTVVVDFPSVFDPLYSASSVVIDMLNEALGPQFQPAVETYTTISRRVIEGYYGGGRAAFWFGWGPPIPSPDARRYVAEMYGSVSPGQRVTRGYGYRGGDPSVIVENGYYGILPWVQQYTEVFRRAGARGPEPSPFWQQHQDYQRTKLA